MIFRFCFCFFVIFYLLCLSHVSFVLGQTVNFQIITVYTFVLSSIKFLFLYTSTYSNSLSFIKCIFDFPNISLCIVLNFFVIFVFFLSFLSSHRCHSCNVCNFCNFLSYLLVSHFCYHCHVCHLTLFCYWSSFCHSCHFVICIIHVILVIHVILSFMSFM